MTDETALTTEKVSPGKIICGFAGIGKSTAALSLQGVVDLESTPFEKDWLRYSSVARHMAANGYTVLLSCHRELREQLTTDGATYLLAMPPSDAKDEYLKRYVERGNTDEFVTLLRSNWDAFLVVMPGESVLYVNEFLAPEIQRFRDGKRGSE